MNTRILTGPGKWLFIFYIDGGNQPVVVNPPKEATDFESAQSVTDAMEVAVKAWLFKLEESAWWIFPDGMGGAFRFPEESIVGMRCVGREDYESAVKRMQIAQTGQGGRLV